MLATRDTATVERARVFVETTARRREAIALEVGISVPTLRNWIGKGGWKRPAEAPRAVPKLPPEKEEPARRAFENRATVADLAVLLGCDTSHVFRLAKQRGWERGAKRAAAEAGSEPRDALKAIEAALRDPALSRPDFVRHAERAMALMAVEAMVSGDARLDRRIRQLATLVDLARRCPEPAAAAPAPQPVEEMSEEELDRMFDDLATEFERMLSRRPTSPIEETTA